MILLEIKGTNNGSEGQESDDDREVEVDVLLGDVVFDLDVLL